MIFKITTENELSLAIDEQLEVPVAAYPYILYQRTGYLREYPLARFLAKTERFQVMRRLSTFSKSAMYRGRIRQEFEDDMKREYVSIRNYLPAKAESVLDIGCGVAGVDVFLSRHYSHKIAITLLDKTAVDPTIYYGFKDSGAFYNSLDLARELLVTNGVAQENIFLEEANDRYAIGAKHGGFDVIISLISWGFHYPVTTYLQAVYDALRPKGVVILDVRKNTEGLEQLQEVFERIETVSDFEKHQRIVAMK